MVCADIRDGERCVVTRLQASRTRISLLDAACDAGGHPAHLLERILFWLAGLFSRRATKRCATHSGARGALLPPLFPILDRRSVLHYAAAQTVSNAFNTGNIYVITCNIDSSGLAVKGAIGNF